ncbi:hypothetical protein [Burkholderia oklahomensis]|nr:hypothetical protein [Burkholderia oklahomensis]MBI0361824.1 hypothetical protein [Burkholderia oklahomensis]
MGNEPRRRVGRRASGVGRRASGDVGSSRSVNDASRDREIAAREIGAAKAAADAIAQDVMRVPKYGEESVSVAFEEIEPHDWTEKVHTPDIRRKRDTLYKKPGYEPL